MSGALFILLGSLGGAIVTMVGGYLVAARRLSGRIGTSEAAALWKESGELRTYLTQRLDAAYARIEALEQEIRRQRSEHHAEVEALEARIVALEEDNAVLRRENSTLRARVVEHHQAEP